MTIKLDATDRQGGGLFIPESWLAKISFINHLILFNNMIVSVLSEKNGGKTSFCKLLLSELDGQIKSLAISIEPPCDRASLINLIAQNFYLNVNSTTTLTEIVQQVNERKAHVLLVIDEAHHLPEELMKEFVQIIQSQSNFAFFHLCLVSDYSMVAMLNDILSEKINSAVHMIELENLSMLETSAFLQHKLIKDSISTTLTKTQTKQFYQMTKGNIAKINNNISGFLSSPGQSGVMTRLNLKQMALSVSALVVLGVSYFLINPEFSSNGDAKAPVVATTPKLAEHLDSIPSIQSLSEQHESQILPMHEASITQLVTNALPKKQFLDDIVLSSDDENTVPIVDRVLVAPKVIKAQLAVPVEPLKKVESKQVKVAKAVKKLPLKNKPALAKHSVSTVSDSARYTIQLLASHEAKYLNRLKGQSHLKHTKIRHFSNAKGVWYVLTVGEYQSKNQAQAQIKKLPKQFAKLNPWVRSVNGLKTV